MIDRDLIQHMFDDARSNPKYTWSIDDVCLWGYFFTGHDEDRLMQAVPHLERLGYTFVDLLKPQLGSAEPEDDDSVLIHLHVERAERHTEDSLNMRNEELSHLAELWGIDYDGMDVGPIKKPGG